MSENKLYPMRLCSLEDTFNWGKEEFKLADLGYRDSLVNGGWLSANNLSEVMETYMDRVVGDAVFSTYGRQFPLQVKHIRCNGKMPLRVHPDDSTAENRYDALGKEKFWYVLKAEKDAELVLGFNKNIDASILLSGIQDGSIEQHLNHTKVKTGDAFRIQPGLVHGAIGNPEIIEISQSSALDFCVYPWGIELDNDEFDSALTIIDALDFIDYNTSHPSPLGRKKVGDHVFELLNLPQFIVNRIELSESIKISSEKVDSFAVYYVLYGKARLKTETEGVGEVCYDIDTDSLILVPAEVSEIIIEPVEKGTALLEALGQTENNTPDNEQK